MLNTFFVNFTKCIFASCDAPEVWQLSMQDPATPSAEGMMFFHNYLVFFLIFVGVFVFWMLYFIIVNYNENANKISLKFTHSSLLEIVWTIIPAIILLLIAIPSFTLLYSLDEVVDPTVTLKVIGHQWYWTYEIVHHAGVTDALVFDSYMVPTSDLSFGSFRLLEVDNRLVLPMKTHIRVLITAADVIHNWAIPSFGMKVDATPGRLSQASLFIKRAGVYYGQCSEICGVNHGFMPIVVVSVPTPKFIDWSIEKLFE
jgi:cytochrome c oxidase subunit 2